MTWLLLIASGVIVGMLSGLLGIGGGVVVIPLLRLGFGLPGLVATGTSLFMIVPTSISGVVGHVRNHSANVKMGLLMGVGGALLSPVGSLAGKAAGDTVVMVCAAVIIVYTSIKMLSKTLAHPKVAGDVAAASQPVASVASTPSQSAAAVAVEPSSQSAADVAAVGKSPVSDGRKRVLQALAVGCVVGFVSGFVGIGGGFIVVPLTMWLFGFTMKEAAGTSLVAIFILAIPGAVTHGIVGDVEWAQGIALAAGSVPGAFLGAKLSTVVPERGLKIGFSVLLLVAGVLLAVTELGWL